MLIQFHRLLFLSLFMLCVSCKVLTFPFDDLRLIWISHDDINSVETPPGFVVTPQEIYGLNPQTKFVAKIYVDNEYYYFTPISDIGVPAKNSAYAKDNSIRVSGVDRSEYLSIIDERKNALERMEALIKRRLNLINGTQ